MKVKTPKVKSSFNLDAIATQVAYKLSRDLGGRIFDNDHHGESHFFAKYQSESVLKKYEFESTDPVVLENEAFEGFHQTLGRVVSSSLNFGLGKSYSNGTEEVLRTAASFISTVLGPFSLENFFCLTRHSGGSSLGVPYSDTSDVRKWTYPITATKRTAELFEKLYLPWDSHLKDAITNVNGVGPHGPKYSLVSSSRATTVPKTSSKRRMIAVEPTLNMFFQQGLMELMYKRLADYGINLSSLPERHQVMAQLGSTFGHLSTIDFSAASDSVSYGLVRRLFPSDWFYWLDRCRSPSMTINGRRVTLPIFATMGNATTFPIETLVFLSLAVGCHHLLEGPRGSSFASFGSNSKPGTLDLINYQISVFGDDCIVPSGISGLFISCTEELGFSVNKEKSFTEGSFRESCGGDFYRGTKVRPFQLKRPHGSSKSDVEAWLYKILNRILPLYIEYFGSLAYLYEQELLNYLFGLFSEYKLWLKFVPSDFPDDAGLQSQDWDRIISVFGIKHASPVKRDRHGTASFKYLRYKYSRRNPKSDCVEYAKFLRLYSDDPLKPSRASLDNPLRAMPFITPIRKNGCYVVATGISSFFT